MAFIIYHSAFIIAPLKELVLIAQISDLDTFFLHQKLPLSNCMIAFDVYSATSASPSRGMKERAL